MANLSQWVKVKKKSNKMPKGKYADWKQLVQKADKKMLRNGTFKVVQDIGEVMALDEEGRAYVEVLKKGDIIDGRRFDERFLRVLVNRKVVEVIG